MEDTHEGGAPPLPPDSGRLRAVIDTDAFNEVDDQFALAHALRSPERLSVEALYAAPFWNERSSGPHDGMERSYGEILKLLELLELSEPPVIRGSTAFLHASDKPQESAAARDLIARAMGGAAPLYVIALGALTNVASALLLEPRIRERIVVVWLGGHALHWPHTREFNLQGDPHAARVILGGVPLVLVPCLGVSSHLLTTVPEIERYVQGTGAVGDFLAERFKAHLHDPFAWGKELWDVAPVAYLLDEAWVPTAIVPCPILTDDLTWRHHPAGRPIRVAQYVNRNAVFRDLFTKLRTQHA